MKKFQNKEKNVTPDYGYRYNNIISQDSTYNQTSDNIYPNDNKKNFDKSLSKS